MIVGEASKILIHYHLIFPKTVVDSVVLVDCTVARKKVHSLPKKCNHPGGDWNPGFSTVVPRVPPHDHRFAKALFSFLRDFCHASGTLVPSHHG